MAFATLASVEDKLALTELSVNEFVLTTIAVFEAAFALTIALTFAFASVAGAFSAGVSAVVCKTEMFPLKAGIARKSADNIKTAAAPIVIFDKIVCEPRG